MARAPAPEVVTAALEKANEHDWWRLASPQFDGGSFPKWAVPSRTTPGQWYLVWRPTQARARLPWWDALECNCPTATLHKRRVCWHKAAVFLRWQHWRTSGSPHDGGTRVDAPLPAVPRGPGDDPQWPASELPADDS